MKRGVVMQVNKKKAVIMTAEGSFVSVPLQSEMQVGEEIIVNTGSMIRLKHRKTRWYSGVAAAILVLILPIFFFIQNDSHPVVAYVSMDINPSIEIGVDKENRVRELRALNDDGQIIVTNISYKGQPLEKVATKIMDKISGSHYLDNPGKEIIITSLLLGTNGSAEHESVLSGKVDGIVKQKLAQLTSELKANVTTLSIPVELRDEATANGISSGKMAVYLMAKSEGYEFTLESFQKQSIDKVTESIDGGVKTIVEKSENMSKEKLIELVEKEKKEKKNKKEAAATPTPSKGNNSSKPAKDDKASIITKPTKPIVTERPKPTPGKTKSPEDKVKTDTKYPSSPQKPNQPNQPAKSSSDKNIGQSDDEDDNDDDNDQDDRDKGDWRGKDWNRGDWKDNNWDDEDQKDKVKDNGNWNKDNGGNKDDDKHHN